MNDHTAVRAMARADLDVIEQLEGTLFGAAAWSRAMLEAELADTQNRWYVVACDSGSIVAYAGLAVLGDEAHVMTIGTRPENQGRGVGRLLLRRLLDEAAGREVRQTVLEVRVDNAAAIALYESEGFEQVAVRRRYYQPEDIDAVVMIRVAG